MPDPVTLSQVAALAAQLPPDERRQLAETILRDLGSSPAAEPCPGGELLSWDAIFADKLPVGRPTPGPESFEVTGDDLLF